MPICLVSKGRRSPTGQIERITASQSCYQLQLNPADFGNMPKNMFPIVIAYNGRDHFVPTIPCSEKDYLAWKVHKEFGSLAAATLLLTKELDRPSLPAGAAQGIKAIEKAIEENLPKISKKAFQYYNTLARRTTTHHRPTVQVTGSVPGTVGSSSSQGNLLDPPCLLQVMGLQNKKNNLTLQKVTNVTTVENYVRENRI